MKLIEKRLADLKEAQKKGKYTLCPRCGQNTMKPDLYSNALSRLADIQICDGCGVDEAKLAMMRNLGTLYSWAGLQPQKPLSDFKALTGQEVWKRISKEQCLLLSMLYKKHEQHEDENEIRMYAFEKCPGLTQIWTEPFEMHYAASDGTVVVRFKRVNGQLEMEAAMIDEQAKK